MTNPGGEDFRKMTGTIICSVNVQGPGDEATELKMGTNKEIEETEVIMPSMVKKTYK